jgi:hypothetical protein
MDSERLSPWLVPCHAPIDASCLSFYLPAALLPQSSLAGRQNYFVILRHFLHDMTLDTGNLESVGCNDWVNSNPVRTNARTGFKFFGSNLYGVMTDQDGKNDSDPEPFTRSANLDLGEPSQRGRGVNSSFNSGQTGEDPVLSPLPRVLGLAAVLFFFSVLDPFSLVIMHVSSLIFLFSTSRALRGLGLIGLSLFLFMIVWTDEISPAPAAIILSSFSFGILLRLRLFEGSFYPGVMSGLITVLSVVILFVLNDIGGLMGWVDELKMVMMETMDKSHLRLQEVGLLELDEMIEVKEVMTGMVDLMLNLLPAAVFINILLASILGLLIFGFFGQSGHPLPVVGELKYFAFSDIFVWGLIAGLFSAVIPLPESAGIILFNVLAVAVLFYLVRGMAVGLFWLRNKGLSNLSIWAIYLFLFLVLPPVFFLALFLPGLLDTWFDFRSLGE